ncbi:unnamed protein product [Prorocentrum cordatum]|uniref:ADP,ATP carrier protein n=2 Tax=Prorocentrum cordatum TaxID=2364126 RepID=A0ABN9SWS0_9DINO|nr:unnamed protein product [Polarella glacialis]
MPFLLFYPRTLTYLSKSRKHQSSAVGSYGRLSIGFFCVIDLFATSELARWRVRRSSVGARCGPQYWPRRGPPAWARSSRTLWTRLYQGFPVAVAGALPAGAMYLTCYELFRPVCERRLGLVPAGGGSEHGFASTLLQVLVPSFVAGLGAEAVSCIFWCPTDIVKERLQVQQDLKLYTYSSSWDAVRTVLRQEGAVGLYRGYGATLLAFGPQTAANLAAYELLEAVARRRLHGPGASAGAGGRRPLPLWVTLPCACVAGCAACLLSNPLDLAKLRMQVVRSQRSARHGAGGVKTTDAIFRYRSVADALVQVARTEGVAALWKGAFFRCLCHVPQTAITVGTFKWLNQ